MNTTRGTKMKAQKISQKMILCVSGVALLLLTAFPQMLWASHGDRIVVSSFFGDLDLVLVDRSHDSRHNSTKGKNCRKKGRHGDYRPVVNTHYRNHMRPAFYRDYRNPGYSRHHPRKHRHPKHKHYYKNKHRQPNHGHYSWR